MVTAPLPDYDILAAACAEANLNYTDAQLIRAHSNSVYLLPGERAVVRIGRQDHGLRARASLTLTRWLSERGVPVTEPLLDHAIDVDACTITVWRYYPQDTRPAPPMRALGAILAQLHALPRPPIELPAYPPLARFTAVLADPAVQGVLKDDDLEFLQQQTRSVLDRYQHLDSRLGVGFIHGDSYTGNCVWDGDLVRLGDWDEACIGPRELDVVTACHDSRFGVSDDEIAEFLRAYGTVAVPEFRAGAAASTLFAMRDLHTLAGYVRRAARGDTPAARELEHRLRTLRHPETPAEPWHAL
ncbi:aminoglycoside phosphotransferase family protein [Nocardia sp. BSTN01]|uniref:phosphotransferase enzyme family protein n=1 Tax=Nocardia sp. BSTN01 TaxID=2783665 RepID=UPI00281637E1|nr:aminoglycoside phosphotransferase family protein [Nocardia sp. BSTN01]